jgi:hypothetical protein
VSDIVMALICELRDTKDNTISAHKTHKLKTHLSHQKCAKTHVRQSGIKKFSGGYTPGPPSSGEPRLTRRGRDASDAGEGREGREGRGEEGGEGWTPNFETVVAPLLGVRRLKCRDALGHSPRPPQPGKNTAAEEYRPNAAVRRQIFGGVGAVGFSAAAKFGGAGSKLAQQPRCNVLCLGSSMTPRDVACFGFRLRLNLRRPITKTLLLNSNSANIIAYKYRLVKVVVTKFDRVSQIQITWQQSTDSTVEIKIIYTNSTHS